ncbi:hypothetical protein BpHYR1_017413 [Brachionus plicatilis]|uniref:Uncharacterized protein n=1 Tax=Brachionus plicatilis TaxID=10195 RepID=A0A3M7SWC9_BRAPC|nr:hypothetical protein BpHYR1_017413 [Brachionus plicatilis]
MENLNELNCFIFGDLNRKIANLVNGTNKIELEIVNSTSYAIFKVLSKLHQPFYNEKFRDLRSILKICVEANFFLLLKLSILSFGLAKEINELQTNGECIQINRIYKAKYGTQFVDAEFLFEGSKSVCNKIWEKLGKPPRAEHVNPVSFKLGEQKNGKETGIEFYVSEKNYIGKSILRITNPHITNSSILQI